MLGSTPWCASGASAASLLQKNTLDSINMSQTEEIRKYEKCNKISLYLSKMRHDYDSPSPDRLQNVQKSTDTP